MEFRILGPLEVREEGRVLKLGGSKQRALLASLLLHASEVVSRDRLIDELWDASPPDTAQTAKGQPAFHPCDSNSACPAWSVTSSTSRPNLLSRTGATARATTPQCPGASWVPKLPWFRVESRGFANTAVAHENPRICRGYRRRARITCTACHAE